MSIEQLREAVLKLQEMQALNAYDEKESLELAISVLQSVLNADELPEEKKAYGPKAIERIKARYDLAIAHRDKYNAALNDPQLEAAYKTAFEAALVTIQREIKLLEWVLHELQQEGA